MSKEFLKEVGKYFLDISKILIAIGFITPLVKEKEINIVIVTATIIVAIIGIYLIYKGTKNDK